MITDSEFVALMNDKDVLAATMNLKKDFLTSEMDFIELGDDDFVALVFLAPTVGIALANGTISLYEQLLLNNKARKLSRGSYFLKKDPVIKGLQFLIKNFTDWENKFYYLIEMVVHSSLKKNEMVYNTLKNEASLSGDFKVDVLNAPYVFVKFLSFIFLEEEDDLMNDRAISKVEHDKILEIAKKISIAEIPLFKVFWETFEVVES